MIFNAANYGEHKMNAGSVIKDLEKESEGYNAFVVRLRACEYPISMYKEIAEFAKKSGKSFAYLYAYQFAPEGKESHLTKEIVDLTVSIAGDLFIGEIMGEAGSDKGAKAKNYFKENATLEALKMPPQNFKNLTEAKNHYVNFISEMCRYNASIGVKQNIVVEATAFSKYNLMGGATLPVLEVMPADPEKLIPFTRGAARGLGNGSFGGFIANEWYGGYRHDDPFKKMRLIMAYRMLYMDGADFFALESGFAEIDSFGVKRGADSEECREYRAAAARFAELIEKDERPAGGPMVKVAFLHGNLDGYTGFMGGSLWSQFDREEWGMSDPEYSWEILDEAERGFKWSDFSGFAGKNGGDPSKGYPYGAYDVLPIESDLGAMKTYDLLIFVGWNTMTEEIYEKLKEYVAAGGTLFATLAHFDVSDERGVRRGLVKGGRYSDFAGFDVTGTVRLNGGIKFEPYGSDGELFPGSPDYVSDCNFVGGYADFAKTEIKGARTLAFFDDRFVRTKDDEKGLPFLTENKYGKGKVFFATNLDYPANRAVWSKYKVALKEILCAMNRKAEVTVIGDEKVKFRVYKRESGYTVYLLNTDFDCPHGVKVNASGKQKSEVIDPAGLKRVDF